MRPAANSRGGGGGGGGVGLEQVDDTTYDVPSVWSLLQNVPVPSVSALYFTLYQVSCLYYIPCIECLGTKSLVFTTYPVLCVLSLLHTVPSVLSLLHTLYQVSCLYHIPCTKFLVFTTLHTVSHVLSLLRTLYYVSCLYYTLYQVLSLPPLSCL